MMAYTTGVSVIGAESPLPRIIYTMFSIYEGTRKSVIPARPGHAGHRSGISLDPASSAG